MRLPARVYLKLNPPATLFASAYTHVRWYTRKFIDTVVVDEKRTADRHGSSLLFRKLPVYTEKTITVRVLISI